MTVKIQESRTYVKKKQREVRNFVNKHKNFMSKLCAPPTICKMYTRENGLYAGVHLRPEAAAHAAADAHRGPAAEKEAGLTDKAHKVSAMFLCTVPGTGRTSAKIRTFARKNLSKRGKSGEIVGQNALTLPANHANLVYKSGCVPGRGKVPFPEGQGRAEGPPA